MIVMVCLFIGLFILQLGFLWINVNDLLKISDILPRLVLLIQEQENESGASVDSSSNNIIFALFCSQLKEGEDTTSTTGLKSWEHSYQSQTTRKLPGRAVALYFTAQGCNGHYSFTTDSSPSSQIRRTF